MKKRCWRTGIDIEGEPGDVCPECGGQHWGEHQPLLREKLKKLRYGEECPLPITVERGERGDLVDEEK